LGTTVAERKSESNLKKPGKLKKLSLVLQLSIELIIDRKEAELLAVQL